jgi:putative ABC transport system permease protein
MSTLAPRWRKVLADANSSFGRLFTTSVAMALSVAAITALLVGRDILGREMPRSFFSANPASALLTLDAIDDGLIRKVRTRPDILAADRAALTYVKVRTGDHTVPLAIYMVADFTAQQVDAVTLQSGAWPTANAIVIERSGLPLLLVSSPDALAGKRLQIETAAGAARTLTVSGTVFDGTQAPSTQELTLYGYVTPAVFAELTSQQSTEQLKVVVDRGLTTASGVEAVARSLALWLRDNGQEVRRIRIPPVGKHPHQWQYDVISLLLVGFGILTLLLEAGVMAVVIGGLLAPQVRQIAVMKAIGARTAQVAAMYATLVFAIAALAAGIGVPVGVYAGYALVDKMAAILNLEIASYSVGPWWILGSAALGILLPLLAALPAILSATRRPIREALGDYGASNRSFALNAVNRALGWFNTTDPVLNFGIRNSVRRGTRLALTMSLLVIAGVVFMVAGNLLSSWDNITRNAAAERSYDLQLYLRGPQDKQAVLDAVAQVPGVRAAETGDSMYPLLDQGDRLSVVGTERNSLPMQFVLPRSELLRLNMSAGRWLQPGDTDAVVLNTAAQRTVIKRSVGGTVDLLFNGKPVRLRIVGIANQAFSNAMAFTTTNIYDLATGTQGRTRSIRVALVDRSQFRAASQAIAVRLKQDGIEVADTVTEETIAQSQTAHVYIMMLLLGSLILGVALVGIMSLTSALSTSVVERTREFGVMRTLGARSTQVFKVVLSEALCIGAGGWLLAIPIAIPLTVLLVKLMGSVMPLSPPLEFSALAALAWLVLSLLFAAIASIYPGRRAVRLTVRAALAHT